MNNVVIAADIFVLLALHRNIFSLLKLLSHYRPAVGLHLCFDSVYTFAGDLFSTGQNVTPKQ